MPRGPKKHLKRLNAPKHWMLGKLGGIFVSIIPTLLKGHRDSRDRAKTLRSVFFDEEKRGRTAAACALAAEGRDPRRAAAEAWKTTAFDRNLTKSLSLSLPNFSTQTSGPQALARPAQAARVSAAGDHAPKQAEVSGCAFAVFFLFARQSAERSGGSSSGGGGGQSLDLSLLLLSAAARSPPALLSSSAWRREFCLDLLDRVGKLERSKREQRARRELDQQAVLDCLSLAFLSAWGALGEELFRLREAPLFHLRAHLSSAAWRRTASRRVSRGAKGRAGDRKALARGKEFRSTFDLDDRRSSRRSPFACSTSSRTHPSFSLLSPPAPHPNQN